MFTESHIHTSVPVLTEGVDLELTVLVGYACSICGKELVSLVPRFQPEYSMLSSPASELVAA